MRARRWWGLALLAITSVASAEPKPKAVDIKEFRDKAIVLQDADGGTYVVNPNEERRVFYGLPKKPLYENLVTGGGGNASEGTWNIAVWAPRVAENKPGTVQKRLNDTTHAVEYVRWCGDVNVPLTLVPADKAKTILDKGTFMSTAFIHVPYMLGRDDNGIYYYVDVIAKAYGGNGYRVFVGKKGALKQKPLSDIAKDTAGDVFATKTGDLRIVRDSNGDRTKITWIKGGKHTELVQLDVDANSTLIFKELGVYAFTGSICENI